MKHYKSFECEIRYHSPADTWSYVKVTYDREEILSIQDDHGQPVPLSVLVDFDKELIMRAWVLNVQADELESPSLDYVSDWAALREVL